ncbi:MAG: CPBP family intramembrane metalloprotease [Butyrivibrio sp.]|nr:CPBP family intramembrane metalloprotease [Butyrivibrio sp.]
MDYKRANRAYLYMILSTLALIILLTAWVFSTGSEFSILANNVLSELVILIPAIATILYCGDRLRVVIPFKRIKISSALLTVLYVVMLFPLVTFINSVSMLFVDNTVVGLSDQILGMPMWQMFLSIGIFGPFVEEVVFRGFFLQSYQRTGRIIASMILSSILFGLMHMNFNQFAYGAVMGLMLALLVEATGSVLTSFIAHATFNSIEVILMYATSDLIDSAENMLTELEETNQILLTIGIYFVAAVIFTTLAFCIVVKISDIERRKEFFAGIPKCPKQGYKLITVPLIVAIVIAVTYMIGIEYLNSLI